MAGTIREAVEMVERWIGVARGEGGGKMRRRTWGTSQGSPRDETRLAEAVSHGDRDRADREGRGSMEDSWRSSATRGSPKEDPTAPNQTKLA